MLGCQPVGDSNTPSVLRSPGI